LLIATINCLQYLESGFHLIPTIIVHFLHQSAIIITETSLKSPPTLNTSEVIFILVSLSAKWRLITTRKNWSKPNITTLNLLMKNDIPEVQNYALYETLQ